MTDDNKAFQDGFTQNTYTGNGSDWAAWQRGQMMRQEEERRRNTPTVQALGDNPQLYKPAKPATPAAPPTTADALALPALVAGIVGIAILPFVAVSALVAVPVLHMAERMLGSSRLDFISAYKLMFKSIGVYGITMVSTGGILAILGNYAAPGLLGAFANIGNAFMASFNHGHAFSQVSYGQMLTAFSTLQVPSLGAFAWMMRREYKSLFAGPRGFWRGLVTGAATIPAGAIGVSITTAILNQIF